jgi:hypothetical protein
MDVNFVHLIVVDLFGRLSDDDFLDFFVVVGGAIGVDEDGLELVDDFGFVVALFLVEAAGNGPGEGELTGVLVLALEVWFFALKILEDEERPEDDILAVKEVLVLDIIAKL